MITSKIISQERKREKIKNLTTSKSETARNAIEYMKLNENTSNKCKQGKETWFNGKYAKIEKQQNTDVVMQEKHERKRALHCTKFKRKSSREKKVGTEIE